jgi:hypothetical protein
MIRRAQSILIAVLILASVAMAALLWQMRQRARQHLLDGEDSAPTQAPAVTPAEAISVDAASDLDGSLQTQNFTLPLPSDSGARARAILGKLLDLYAAPGSNHPVPGGAAAVTQVFLLPAQPLYAPAKPVAPPSAARPASSAPNSAPESGDAANGSAAGDAASDQNSPQLAVINLTSAFANNHPSGLQAETLTLLSIISTLHLNLPRITQVRFLVDGQLRATLNGHADLTRTYLVTAEPQQ